MSHSKSAALPSKPQTEPVVTTTRKRRPKASPKPHPDYPLTARKDGRWCKKIKGKVYIFKGTADEALTEYERVKGDLLLGRAARAKGGTLTVVDLINSFLTHKQQLRDNGELAPRTFDRYYSTCTLLVTAFGKASIDTLVADDFQTLRAAMAKRWGPIALGNEIQIVRSIFRYGYDAGLLANPVRFGPGFKKPSAKTLRQTRTAGGPKLFTPEQIKALLKVASPNMAAMILLAINGALGNTDLAELPAKAADLKAGWLDYPRPKTGMPRRIPLWPETVKAICKAMKCRGTPKDEADALLLFIGTRGESYVGNHKGYRVTQEFDRFAGKAKVEGRTFYDLRRTFQTVGEGSRDLVAVQSIMGHAPSSGDMSAIYRQGVEPERLQAVVAHVRTWLFAKRKAR